MQHSDTLLEDQVDTLFEGISKKIIGHDLQMENNFGKRKLVYADWIASGRLYEPIERLMTDYFGPLVGNTHSESSLTGEVMTAAYKMSYAIIKKHVNANQNDVMIATGSGMTGALAKLQRILGLHIPEKAKKYYQIPAEEKPVVFITHMEHHSNQTSWLECEVDVVVVPPGDNLEVVPENLEKELARYKSRKVKIGSFTACSNVTGVFTPYHQLASIMHRNGGLCFVDFAASAPYADMDMHPKDPTEALDAIFFSPHKFLGGPGSPGVLIFNKQLYSNRVPDQPGGGTVTWTNPWGEHHYFEDIEAREDGGTPAFLQLIRAALAVRLKEQMGVANIKIREERLLKLTFEKLNQVPGLIILAPQFTERLGVISFYIENLHFNFVVRALSDHFGIQVRGGCSCAGTYGHYLLHVTEEQSKGITQKIDAGDFSSKPGWIRLSLHPVMTKEDVSYICDAIKQVALSAVELLKLYEYSVKTNEYYPLQKDNRINHDLAQWFKLEL